MDKSPVGIRTHHVDVGTSSEIERVSGADLKVDGCRNGPVDQVMAVACTFRERRAISGAQHAEVANTASIAKAPSRAQNTRLIEWRWIT
jgi:hypothetical protein